MKFTNVFKKNPGRSGKTGIQDNDVQLEAAATAQHFLLAI
jgi:hypothetical protein